ncbi:hypothetical protein [Nostoc edaphicum]
MGNWSNYLVLLLSILISHKKFTLTQF